MKTISDYTIYCTPEQTKKTLELVAKWLRDKKNLHLDMYYDTEFNIWRSSISEENEEEFVSQSYEEAFSAGIDKAIEILKIIKYGKDN